MVTKHLYHAKRRAVDNTFGNEFKINMTNVSRASDVKHTDFIVKRILQFQTFWKIAKRKQILDFG